MGAPHAGGRSGPAHGRARACTELDLSGNRLRTLPDHLLLPVLVAVDLSENELAELPPVVFRWPRLARLDARRNRISALPAAPFQQLPELTDLHVDDNPLDGSHVAVLGQLSLPAAHRRFGP